MSFDVFVVAVPIEGEDSAVFDRSIVVEAFKSFTDHQDTDSWSVRYPDGDYSFATLYVGVAPVIEGFSADRPPSFRFPPFWEAMFTVLRQSRTMMAWPADEITRVIGFVDE